MLLYPNSTTNLENIFQTNNTPAGHCLGIIKIVSRRQAKDDIISLYLVILNLCYIEDYTKDVI
jgi:hypothetical protein